MKRLVCLMLMLLSISYLQAQDLFIEGGWLFTATEDTVKRNPGIWIKSGKIFTIGHEPETEIRRIVLSDEDYILPGIIDLHAHYRVTFDGIRKDETEVNPVVYLANGVTATFTAGEIEPEKMMNLRKQINRGKKIGPRLLNSGPYFGSALPTWDKLTTPRDIRVIVDKWAELGVSGFKAKGIRPELLQALIERAHQHGLTVTAHLGSGYENTVNPQEAILMGIDRVEHFLGGELLPPTQSAYESLQDIDPYDPKLYDVMSLFIKHKVYFDATVTAYGYYGDRTIGYEYWTDEKKYLTPYARSITKDIRQEYPAFDKIFKIKRVTIKRFYDAGGLITLGTDHPSVGEYLPGFSAHREMYILSASGIPNADVIKIATINGANALRVGDKIGSIEVGKFGDMFITKGNPLLDIRNSRNVHTVIKGGVVYDTQEILKSVECKMGPYHKGDWNDGR
ncbi:MAG: amidohydrolase family protein [Bacteroidota bacterium]